MTQCSIVPVLLTGLAFEIVQAFLQCASNPNLKLAIVRVLERTDADPGNVKVVHEHGNIRFKYKLHTFGDVQMELVTVPNIQRLAMIVADTHDISVR